MKVLLQHVAVALLSSLFTCWICLGYVQTRLVTSPDPRPTQLVHDRPIAPINVSPTPTPLPDFIAIARQATEAVVSITAHNTMGYRVSSGSGVILSADGYIITNHHVIEDGQTIRVTLPDKRTLQAKLIGKDLSTDLALLKVSANNLSPLLLGNSNTAQVGEWVLAVGNPFDLNSTVTAGIISAKARNIHILQNVYAIESFLQTDAVVNPGNSGGALVNARGELIGINTAIISESGGYEGYSFAIPSNLVRKVMNDLLEFGEVKRAVLGVSILELSEQTATELGLPRLEGVYVSDVTRGSSAYEAGLRPGDVIISVAQVRVSSVPELQEQVALFRPGDRVSLEYYRGGRKHRIDNILLKNTKNTTSYR